MIPQPVLTQWRLDHPWPTDEQVEQDLLLSQLAILLASHPLLGEHLVWRGGTCLHKPHLPVARRYSEDLDYVLVGRPGPTGWLVDAIREAIREAIRDAIREAIADSPLREMSRQVGRDSTKVLLGGDATSTVPLRVKIEVNTDELPAAIGLVRISHVVDTRWWSGRAEVATFHPAELVGTKFRALAQRRKGRDLWDMWLARTELNIADDDLARAATELILWSDEHLDPLFDASRSPTAIERERKRWAHTGWAPGNVRGPHHELTAEGTVRCPQSCEPGGHCPDHPPA